MLKHKKIIIISFLVVTTLGLAVFFSLPRIIGARANGLFLQPGTIGDATVSTLHAGLFVSDLHADTLLWDRSFLEKGSYGHVDLPRLQKGGVALQALSVVTKAPIKPNVNENPSHFFDGITLLSLAQLWPPATWGNLTERALHQVKKLDDAIAKSKGKIRKILTHGDLIKFREDRQSQSDLVGVWLTMEGAHALAGDMSNLDVFFQAGFRMIGPAHLFDNEFAGSQSGEKRYGFTELGQKWLKAIESKKIIIDLAHLSPTGIDEALAVIKYPPIVSHTGIQGVCNIPRNLSDEQIQKIAKKGGLIGIGLWDQILCGRDLMLVVKSVKYVCDLVGCQHVAIGSDWDGFVTTAIDAEHIGLLTAALEKANFTESEIRGIMGENIFRFLVENLP